jgi:hypothetical protein
VTGENGRVNSICRLKQIKRKIHNLQIGPRPLAQKDKEERTLLESLCFSLKSLPKRCASLFFLAEQLRDLCLMRRRRQCGSARRAAPRCLPAISVAWFSHLGPFSALTGRERKISAPKSEIVCFSFELNFCLKIRRGFFQWNTGAQLSVSVNETNRMRFLLFKTRQMRKMGGTGARTDGTGFRGHLFCR